MEPILKGQGAANTVFEYKNPEKCGHVIRIRSGNQAAADDRTQALEQEAWREIGLGDAPPLESDLRYISGVIRPLIGPQYLAPQELIALSEDEASLYGASAGVIMPDATLLPPLPPSPSPAPLPPTVCVELKPKFGSISTCDTVKTEDAPLKHSNSRFRLHQALKAELRGGGSGADASEHSVSAYDPLDLFSGNSDRMETALHALLDSPQNNLALFVDGVRTEVPAALCAVAAALFPQEANVGDQMTQLAALIRAILQQESVLSNVAAAQRACSYDIEGIYRLYMHLLGDDNAGDCPSSDSEQIAAVAELLARPRPAALGVLRSYVVSATAKDCSIMISMRREPTSEINLPAQRQGGAGWTTGGWLPFDEGSPSGGVRYRIAVVDLDRKPFSKIPKHLELDRRIVAAAWRCLDRDPSAYSLQ